MKPVVKGRGTAWRIAGRYERRACTTLDDGCIHCYARPTHRYADLSPGLDFETRILAKTNAADRLREERRRPCCVPRPLNLGSATDAYQPVERTLKLTRQVIEVLHDQHAHEGRRHLGRP